MFGFVLSRTHTRHRSGQQAAVLLILTLLLALLGGCAGGSGTSSKSKQVSLTSKNAKGRFNDTRVYASYKNKDGDTVRVAEIFFVKHKSNPNKVYIRARNLTEKSGTITLTTKVGSKDPLKWDPETLPPRKYVDIGPLTVPDGVCFDITFDFKQEGKKTRSSKPRDGNNVVCIEKSKNSKRS